MSKMEILPYTSVPQPFWFSRPNFHNPTGVPAAKNGNISLKFTTNLLCHIPSYSLVKLIV